MSIQRMLRLVMLLFVGGITVGLPPAVAVEKPGSQTEGPSRITVKDGRLSVRGYNRSLEWVLEEIARAGRVAIIRAEGVGGQHVSVQFQDLPFDEGLRQILQEYDAFFFYGGVKKAPASLRAVWVYRQGQGQGLAPVPPESWASTKELGGRLTDPDPEARSRAVEALITRTGAQTLDAVLRALEDGDDRVRTRALYGALWSDVPLPADTLRGLLREDPSPDVRFLALEALAKQPHVEAIAQLTLSDPSPQVQQKAQEILRRLHAAPSGQEPPQPARP